MLYTRFLLICFALLAAFLTANAQQQNISFTALTTRDGLSSNTVNAILKDRYGFLWFGTTDGLDKFDGHYFTVYRHKTGDSTSLRANEILSLHEDSKGNLWVGTSGGSLSLYDRKRDAFVTFPANGANNSIGNNVIRGICSDKKDNIWIAHYDGIDRLNPRTGKVTNLKLSSNQPGEPLHGVCVFEDSNQQLWFGTSAGLWQYNPATGSAKQFLHDATNPATLSGNQVNAIAEDQWGNLWIGTEKGLSKLPPGSSRFSSYRQNKPGVNTAKSFDFVTSIGVDGEKLWIGTAAGLLQFDTRTGQAFPFVQDNRNRLSLGASAVQSILIDRQGIYWFGTPGGGVNKYDKNLNLFNHIQSNPYDEKGLPSPTVNAFAEAPDGKVYVGTEKGLSLFNPKTGLFQHLPLSSRRAGASQPVLALCMGKTGRLYVGTFTDGLHVQNASTGRSVQLLKGAGPNDLNSNEIFCIYEDRQGHLWVGTNGEGVNVLDQNLNVTKRFTPTPKGPHDVKLPLNGYLRDIVEDRDGNIWLATHGGGTACYHTATGTFTVYHTGNSNLPNDKVQTLLEDRNGNIWAGTLGGGIGIVDRKKKQITVLSEKDGLQNNSVYKILEDPSGRKWISSNQGISVIDPVGNKISHFNHHNGVQQNNFVRGAGLLLSNGDVFFGGLEGINTFNAAFLKKNNNIPRVLITGLTVSNQSVSPSEDGPLQTHISLADEINLDYKQNFALRFVGLSFTSPEQNQYAYKLEGFDKEWNYVGNNNTASFTNLDPGDYTFRVKAGNNDEVWNETGTSLRIRIHPPFWRTTLAYILYGLFLIGLVLYIRHKGIQKLQRKFAVEQEKMKVEQERKEAARIHEMDLLKIKFLTNLSHEFRTPISLILGPVTTLLQQQKNEPAVGQLHMIKRNGKRLLNLVNQLLDFRKMEEHELRLNATEGELVSFILEAADSFRDLSERKNIPFTVEAQPDNFHTLFDHDKLERILFNLLSNAFKFTLPGGEIKLVLKNAANGKGIHINVSDTGIGIPEDKKEKIFEHFYQNRTPVSILNQGTGLGLSITKEFVRMHGGTISVESQPEVGTTFLLYFPFVRIEKPDVETSVRPEATPVETVSEPMEKAAENPVTVGDASELPAILLVEDNEDFRFYLKDNLRLQYKVLEATNGKEGWQKALAHHPQLIVSDVNMPQMDGIALCRKLKGDKRTSHVPVILLTALAGEEDQVKGLQTGANDYVTKPFNFEILNAKIKNLLHLNTQLKNTYSKQIKVLAPEEKFESADEKLLQTIAVYLEENLTNSQLSVEELSRHVGMSRSTLYSKLLELTGQTPVEYIRSLKLGKAAAMLEKSDMNVAQVAYSAGFSTPNYFAKSFKAKYGMLPSEYMAKMRKSETAKSGS